MSFAQNLSSVLFHKGCGSISNSPLLEKGVDFPRCVVAPDSFAEQDLGWGRGKPVG